MLSAISLKNASFSMSFDWLLSMIYDLLYDKPNYVRCSSGSTISWKAVNDMITGYFFAMCSSPTPSLMALLSIHISSGTTL